MQWPRQQSLFFSMTWREGISGRHQSWVFRRESTMNQEDKERNQGIITSTKLQVFKKKASVFKTRYILMTMNKESFRKERRFKLNQHHRLKILQEQHKRRRKDVKWTGRAFLPPSLLSSLHLWVKRVTRLLTAELYRSKKRRKKRIKKTGYRQVLFFLTPGIISKNKLVVNQWLLCKLPLLISLPPNTEHTQYTCNAECN